MPKVSVIVPVYNVEEYLRKCLDSLVKQTLEDIEIIVVNDGSTDGSQLIIDEYVSKYPSKVISYVKENGGQGTARNFALTKANGEYVSFVDSDDWVDTNMFKVMFDAADKNNADLVTSKMLIVRNGVITNEETPSISTNDTIKTFIINQAGPCAKIIRKSLIINNNLLFPDLRSYEDIAVVPAYALYASNIIEMKEKYYYYLMREGSTMKQVEYNEKLENIYISLQYLYDIFKKESKDKVYSSELEYIYVEHLLHSAGLRFIQFSNYKKNINMIRKVMKEKYPKWNKNEYFKLQSFKYKLMCVLLFNKMIRTIKLLKK